MAKIRIMLVSVGLLLLASNSVVSAIGAVPPPAAAGSTLDQRIIQRKAERGAALSKEDTDLTVSTCLAAQGKIRLVQSDAVAKFDNRVKVYNRVDARLWTVIGQLKLADQDTFELEKMRQTLVNKTGTFQGLAADYSQALDDATLINCKGDPAGFQALLNTARLYYTGLQQQSDDSRDYVINTIKPALGDFIKALQPKSSSSEDN